jgi:hypothetical protein
MRFEAIVEETHRIKIYVTVEADDVQEAIKLIHKHETDTEDELSSKTLKRWKILSKPKLIKGSLCS